MRRSRLNNIHMDQVKPERQCACKRELKRIDTYIKLSPCKKENNKNTKTTKTNRNTQKTHEMESRCWT
jgi:hypothetical protein